VGPALLLGVLMATYSAVGLANKSVVAGTEAEWRAAAGLVRRLAGGAAGRAAVRGVGWDRVVVVLGEWSMSLNGSS
jgi:hypothetical protein